MIKKELRDRMIEEVMGEFDFEKVHAFMVINEEKFYEGGNYYTPTVDDVKQVAADSDNAVIDELERQAAAGKAALVARFNPRSEVRAGDQVTMAVRTDQMNSGTVRNANTVMLTSNSHARH